MPTEGGSCLFSILKWAANDRPYIVNRRPMIAHTSLMGGPMIALHRSQQLLITGTGHSLANRLFFYKPTMCYYRRKVR